MLGNVAASGVHIVPASGNIDMNPLIEKQKKGNSTQNEHKIFFSPPFSCFFYLIDQTAPLGSAHFHFKTLMSLFVRPFLHFLIKPEMCLKV